MRELTCNEIGSVSGGGVITALLRWFGGQMAWEGAKATLDSYPEWADEAYSSRDHWEYYNPNDPLM